MNRVTNLRAKTGKSYDTAAATEPILSEESILAKVREVEKPTSTELRSVYEMQMEFSRFIELEEVQR